MLKDNVLVRKMVGIETAGSLNLLFTDKTGTITKGKMQVISVIDGSLKEYTAKTLKNVYDNYATTHPHYTNLLQDGGCGLSKKEISTKWGQLN